MKLLKYIFVLALFLAAGACSKDQTDTPIVDTAKRDAFAAQTVMGVYQDNKAEYSFSKAQNQLYINPSDRISRIQNNKGSEYVEVQLSAMPTVGGEAVGLTLRENVKLTAKPETVILLKSDSEHLWLWNDDTSTGYLVPWIAE